MGAPVSEQAAPCQEGGTHGHTCFTTTSGAVRSMHRVRRLSSKCAYHGRVNHCAGPWVSCCALHPDTMPLPTLQMPYALQCGHIACFYCIHVAAQADPSYRCVPYLTPTLAPTLSLSCSLCSLAPPPPPLYSRSRVYMLLCWCSPGRPSFASCRKCGERLREAARCRDVITNKTMA